MDRELVVRARGGDREAFSEVAAGSVARLYAVGVLILRDTSRADDAVQDALITAWRDLRALRDPDAWDAWSYRLMVRACYRAIRNDRKRPIELHMVPPVTAATADQAQEVVDRDLLERAMREVGIDHRAVLVLHFYVGLPITEVAEVLGIPVGTAKSRLHRALEVLRHQLVGTSAEPGTTEWTA